MANTLDISLDNMNVRRNGGSRGRGWGRGMAHGRAGMYGERAADRGRGMPLRANIGPSPFKIAKSFSRTRDMIWKHDLFNDSMEAAGLAEPNNGTKLYISNLDYGVSNEDIKELFSEIGELKRSVVHYDRNGRSSGSAEVIFIRRSDALAALKRYNNVQLDGKAMKIEIIGDNVGLPVSVRVNLAGRSNSGGRRIVSMMPKLGQAGASQFNRLPRSKRGGIQAGRGNLQARRGRGGFQPVNSRGRGGFQPINSRGRGGSQPVNSRGRGGFQPVNSRGRGGGRGRGRGRNKSTDKSADQLDKELETYHAEAMNTS